MDWKPTNKKTNIAVFIQFGNVKLNFNMSRVSLLLLSEYFVLFL
jgi:hypothetical protein